MKKADNHKSTYLESNVRQTWQLQTAKAKFSELFRQVRSDGPQLVTRQGREAVVVIALEEYEQLVGRKRQSIVEFFRQSPLVGVELDLERERDFGRDIEL